MADRRMFHAGVVESDSFLDMTPAAQALYFHLGMQADDDGFINGPRQVCRRCGAQIEQLQELLDGGFLLWFDGVAVLKHFRMANTLQLDRIKQLRYPEIAKQIYLLPNRIYSTEEGKKKDNLFFIRAKTLRELKKKGMRRVESKRNPNLTQPNSTQSNSTQSNSTQSNLTQPNPLSAATVGVGHPDDPRTIVDRSYAPQMIETEDYRKQPSVLFLTERAGLVELTNEQMYHLLSTMGYQPTIDYIKKLASYLKEKGANIKDHYATLLKWWQEDGGM